MRFLSECGVSRTDVEIAFNRAKKARAARPFPSVPIIMILAECLHEWHTSSKYTGDFGAPLPLLRNGKKSLRSLFIDCGFDDPEDLIDASINLGLIKQQGKAYLPRSRDAVVPRKHKAMPLWYTCQAVHRSFEAMTDNLRSEGSVSPQLLHRTAHQLTLGKKHMALFRRFVSVQGSEFLEMVDDWMTQHSAKTPEEPSLPVSVHAFAWVGDTPGGPLARRPQSKELPKRVKPKRRNT